MVSLLHAVRDIGRLRDITRVLVRHGFGEIVRRIGLTRRTRGGRSEPPIELDAPEDEARGDQERREISLAVRARMVLEDLGPSLVKLGQIASTRADVLPPDLIAELTKLQDSVSPLPFEKIKAQVESSLGTDISEVYAEFEQEPLASASIAQVHRAVLRTEEGPKDVVVKVQRPGISATIASDLDILHALASMIERAIPESRVYSPIGLVQQFDHAIHAELDFSSEADNALRFARNFEHRRDVRFPHVYREASRKHVLTLEYLDGKKIHDAMAQGHSGRKLARVAMSAIVQQIFEDGFFHADPHPGNVLVLGQPEEPTLALIDLGMVGRLSPKMRDLTVDLMVAVVRRDYDAIADAVYAIGAPTRRIEMDPFRADIALLAEKYLGRRLKDIELSALIADLVKTATRFGLEIPTDFVLVGKALMTIEGIGKQVDPDLDVFEETKPLFLDLVRKRYSPERIGNELLRRIEKLSGATYNVPQRLEEVLDDLRLGRLKVRAEDPGIVRAADRLGRRVFVALVASALVLAGAWLLTHQGNNAFGTALLAAAAVLVALHLVFDASRSKRQD
jgi:ubiquinone biosynthesis protein